VRIVAGTLRGRTIAGPKSDDTRPTSDRVRGAIFNILAHGIADFAMQDVCVLDLFAGTGALGFEALSRGAAYSLFVDSATGASAVIKANITTFGLDGRAEVKTADATRLRPWTGRQTFGLVFLDPPYGKGLAEKALAAAAAGNWLSDETIAVVEEQARASIAWPPGFDVVDVRRWGDTQALFARYRRS
jgi:16S rRNA (guanine966-N2)-methyltransferase